MDISIQKAKTQSFTAWIVDNLRSQQINIWRQLGLWSFIFSAAVLWCHN